MKQPIHPGLRKFQAAKAERKAKAVKLIEARKVAPAAQSDAQALEILAARERRSAAKR